MSEVPSGEGLLENAVNKERRLGLREKERELEIEIEMEIKGGGRRKEREKTGLI